MKPFVVCEGTAAPLLQSNIDTDMIIRIERIAQLSRGELGLWAFETWRYTDNGEHNPDFILNREPFTRACILIAGANFGCGSSREMAVWALEEFGIRCVIAPSFGDIFFSNCIQNGVLPVILSEVQVQQLARQAQSGIAVRADLQAMLVSCDELPDMCFTLDEGARQSLLQGRDEIGQTLMYGQNIGDFQARDRQLRPWVYSLE
jgi:3-isopropylmalate/(R)-2-methylmalate dehydratase small subunit